MFEARVNLAALTWTGGTSTDWDDPNNWSGDPANSGLQRGDSVTFLSGGENSEVEYVSSFITVRNRETGAVEFNPFTGEPEREQAFIGELTSHVEFVILDGADELFVTDANFQAGLEVGSGLTVNGGIAVTGDTLIQDGGEITYRGADEILDFDGNLTINDGEIFQDTRFGANAASLIKVHNDFTFTDGLVSIARIDVDGRTLLARVGENAFTSLNVHQQATFAEYIQDGGSLNVGIFEGGGATANFTLGATIGAGAIHDATNASLVVRGTADFVEAVTIEGETFVDIEHAIFGEALAITGSRERIIFDNLIAQNQVQYVTADDEQNIGTLTIGDFEFSRTEDGPDDLSFLYRSVHGELNVTGELLLRADEAFVFARGRMSGTGDGQIAVEEGGELAVGEEGYDPQTVGERLEWRRLWIENRGLVSFHSTVLFGFIGDDRIALTNESIGTVQVHHADLLNGIGFQAAEIINSGLFEVHVPEASNPNVIGVHLQNFAQVNVRDLHSTATTHGEVHFVNYRASQADPADPVSAMTIRDLADVYFGNEFGFGLFRVDDNVLAGFDRVYDETNTSVAPPSFTFRATDSVIGAGAIVGFEQLTLDIPDDTSVTPGLLTNNGELRITGTVDEVTEFVWSRGHIGGDGTVLTGDFTQVNQTDPISNKWFSGSVFHHRGVWNLDSDIQLMSGAQLTNFGEIIFDGARIETDGASFVENHWIMRVEENATRSVIESSFTQADDGFLQLKDAADFEIWGETNLEGRLGQSDAQQQNTLRFFDNPVVRIAADFMTDGVTLHQVTGAPIRSLNDGGLFFDGLILDGDGLTSNAGMTINQSLVWTNGDISVADTLTFVVDSTVTYNPTDQALILDATVLNFGNVAIRNFDLVLGDGQTFNNHGDLIFGSAGGLWSDLEDAFTPQLINHVNSLVQVSTDAVDHEAGLDIHFINQGTLHLTQGIFDLKFGYVQNDDDAFTKVEQNATLRLPTIGDALPFVRISNGDVQLLGQVIGDFWNEGGTLFISTSTPQLILGRFAQSEDATLHILFDAPPPEELILAVTDSDDIAGRLVLDFLSDFQPTPGDRYRVVGSAGGGRGWFRNAVPFLPTPDRTYSQRNINGEIVVVVDGVRSLHGKDEDGNLRLLHSDGSEFTNEIAGQWEFDDLLHCISGDFNGDGFTDHAAIRAGGQVVVKLQDAETGQLGAATVWGHWNDADNFDLIEAHDADRDGSDDLIAYNGGAWQVGLSNGADTFTIDTWSRWSPNANWQELFFADFNGDGRTDVAGRSGASVWWVGLSDGAGKFHTAVWGRWRAGAGWTNVSVTDINGDGRADVIGRVGGNWWVGVSQDDRFVATHYGSWNHPAEWTDVIILDANGDGLLDVAGRRRGSWLVSLSDGQGNFMHSHWGRWSTNATWNDVTVADVNADGRDDIIARVNGTWWASVSTGDSFTTTAWGRADGSPNWTGVGAGAYV